MRTLLANLERRATALTLMVWLLAGPAAIAAREAFASCGMPCCRTEKECCCRRAARESKGHFWKKSEGCSGKCRLSLTGIRVAPAGAPSPARATHAVVCDPRPVAAEGREFVSRAAETCVRDRAPPAVS